MELDLSKELVVAIDAATKAGYYLRDRKDINIDSAEGKDLKLSSDKLSEGIIIDILSQTGLPCLSEETGLIGEKGDKYWIIDPLDGSVNYYRGIDEYCCVSIALWENDAPVLGVINRFMRDEIYVGEVGSGASLNGENIFTSDAISTAKSIMASGFPVKRQYDDKSLSEFVSRVQSFKKVRMFGTAAVSGAFVASGKVDAYFEEEIMLWDIAGAMAIVKAAGGACEVELLEEYKCNCRLFASEALKEDFHAQSL